MGIWLHTLIIATANVSPDLWELAEILHYASVQTMPLHFGWGCRTFQTAQSSSRLTHAINSFIEPTHCGTGPSTVSQLWRNLAWHWMKCSIISRLYKNQTMNEVDDHESQVHGTLTKCCDDPPGTKTIMSIWSFKRKQYPDGTLNKHKACLCAHGGMQT